ncbi:ice-binding family protein [Microbacterium marmarense]|uniref:Ice-binding family protein n=1 Tax=Microbacterium marmarense TaxID=3122051 RepID=A0ABU8LV79_9MICO
MFKASSKVRFSAAIITAVFAVALVPSTAAYAEATELDLGTASPFGVLGASTVTNTGDSVINGNLGVSPGTSITGFPPGIINGDTEATTAVATQAQSDALVAYNNAASQTPTPLGLDELSGKSLEPGVYSGGAISLNGSLVLEGTAESVWIFQAASTLLAASNSEITVTGGASVCNVFWQVGSSATIGTSATFVGTVLAYTSITANTGATIDGRLLALTGAVTLDDNLISVDETCDTTTPVETASPAITSSAPAAGETGTPYSHTVTATGTPAPTYSSSGTLPTGTTLDSATGVISGTPTTPGTFVFTITASNGATPDAIAEYSVAISAAATPTPTDDGSDEGTASEGNGTTDETATESTAAESTAVTSSAASTSAALLAESGLDPKPSLLAAGALLLLGAAMTISATRRKTAQ